MPTAQKANIIENIKNRMESASAFYVVDFKGIDVQRLTKLRRNFRDVDSEFIVVKNTLARIAANSIDHKELSQFFQGPTAIVFCQDDLVAPAKVLSDFITESRGLIKIKGGIVEGQIVDDAGVKQVANLPPREYLLALVVGALQSPVSGFVGVLSGVLRNLVGVLDAIAKDREKKGDSAI
ncbi:MAG: 50S ribosomal protein L10 [Candidatus Cloacimonetes bacterium 4572_55]|nr:MAG: 50S ribosomal protein L10 [Candidatus Cloacimonetes bacterium 4572_55]